jgi:hypothetical protein
VATDDELAKKQVQEAVWTWASRVIVLSVVFGFGFFAGWVQFGAGENGSPALRVQKGQLEGQLVDLNKKRNDAEGKLVVVTGRLEECQKNLNRAAGAPATP